jgi:hypothetical protein
MNMNRGMGVVQVCKSRHVTLLTTQHHLAGYLNSLAKLDKEFPPQNKHQQARTKITRSKQEDNERNNTL